MYSRVLDESCTNRLFSKTFYIFVTKYSKLFAVFPEKDPSQMNCQHFNNVI